MKIDIKKLLCLVTLVILVSSIDASALKTTDEDYQEKPKDVIGLMGAGALPSPSESPSEDGDLDPLADLAITVTIKEIRALDKIDLIGEPDFYVKLIIDGVEHTSSIWRNQKYVESNWSVTQNVPDDKEFVNVTIQLWDRNLIGSKLCDVSPNSMEIGYNSNHEANLMYSLNSGHWFGDDFINAGTWLFDLSGYGRLNGCDDNSIYQNDKDCELWFDITQNDYDSDGIPYWTEVNVFGTDPEVDDRGMDSDSDGVPVEWEFKWGHYFSYDWHNDLIENNWYYNPFVWEDHEHFDPDEDGLDNIEEYLTSQWGSDPFRQEIFLELDQMEIGPNGEGGLVPDSAKEMLRDVYGKHNIVFLIDDGQMGGGEIIPFDNGTTSEERRGIYYNHFLQGDYDNWRQGVFHYCIIVYKSTEHVGFVFNGGDESFPYADSFILSSGYQESKVSQAFPIHVLIYKKFTKDFSRTIVYAGAMMHETGHILGIYSGNTPGCDNQNTYVPWQISWWKWQRYRSCMNYAFVYLLVDYSDGSNGKNDFDDWSRIDLTLFQGN